MTLDARSIALQGLGFGVLAVALHGLVGVAAPSPSPDVIGGGDRRRLPRRPLIHPFEQDDEDVLVLVAMALQVLNH